jgi:hypothetical protein
MTKLGTRFRQGFELDLLHWPVFRVCKRLGFE